MFKKLMVLALVLSLASVAFGANVNFLGPNGADWDVASNWANGSVPGNNTGVWDNARPAGFNIAVTTNVVGPYLSKIQYRGVAGSGITMAAGSSLSQAGSFEHDNGSGTTLTQIDAGATLNACTQANGASIYTSYKLGRAEWSTGHSQLTVNGTLNVQSGATWLNGSPSASELAIGIWGMGNWSGSSATLDIGATGVVNADVLQMNTNGAADCDVLIDIVTGGKMVLLSDQRSVVQAYRALGLIVGDSGASWIGITYDGSYTTVQTVPEPMTIALLGLGGLALLRKRR